MDLHVRDIEQALERHHGDKPALLKLLRTVVDWSKNGRRRQVLLDEGADVSLVPMLLEMLSECRGRDDDKDNDAIVATILQIFHAWTATSVPMRQVLTKAIPTLLALSSDGTTTTTTIIRACQVLQDVALLEDGACRILSNEETDFVWSKPLLQSGNDNKQDVATQVAWILANAAGHTVCHPPLVPILCDVGQAMQKHSNNADFQQAACQVWWNVLAPLVLDVPSSSSLWKKKPTPPTTTFDFIREAWELHGFLPVVQALTAHGVPHAGVAEAACGALAAGPLPVDQRVKLTELLWYTLQHYGTSCDQDKTALDVATSALRALASASRDCGPAQEVLRNYLRDIFDNDSILSTTLATTPHGALGLLDMCATLAVECPNAAACAVLVDAHVVERTVQMMQTHQDEPTVLDAAVLVLWGIAQHYGKHVAAVASEVVDQTLETHGPQKIRYGKRLQGRLHWKQKWGRR